MMRSECLDIELSFSPVKLNGDFIQSIDSSMFKVGFEPTSSGETENPQTDVLVSVVTGLRSGEIDAEKLSRDDLVLKVGCGLPVRVVVMWYSKRFPNSVDFDVSPVDPDQTWGIQLSVDPESLYCSLLLVRTEIQPFQTSYSNLYRSIILSLVDLCENLSEVLDVESLVASKDFEDENAEFVPKKWFELRGDGMKTIEFFDDVWNEANREM